MEKKTNSKSDKRKKLPNGRNVGCEHCHRKIAILAPRTRGQVILQCPWCGGWNNKADIPWSEVWRWGR